MSTLGDLVASEVLEFSDGYRTKGPELSSSGYRILRVADVHDGWISLDGTDHVDSRFARQIGRKAARDGDILLTTKGTIGRMAVVSGLAGKTVVYSPQLCFFRVLKEHELNPVFFRYWFSSADALRQISIYSGNTDMAPYLSLRDIGQIDFEPPRLNVQRAIAEVLAALDNKIAANRRVVESGLTLLDALYLNSAKQRGSVTFDEIADIGGGGTPSTKEAAFWDGNHRWATPTDVTGLGGPWLLDTERHITQAGLDRITSKLHPRRTLLMTSRASIGYCALTAAPTALNQGFIALAARDPRLQAWLFAQLRNRKDEFLAWANGATFLELPKGIFKSLQVDLPTDNTLDYFQPPADALLDRMEGAQQESQRLAATRDELLPLLMTGRITVKDAERRVEEEV